MDRRSDRWWRLLMRLYPPDFRRRYGDSMLDFIHRQAADLQHSTFPARALETARTVLDLLLTAARARLAALGASGAGLSLRQGSTASSSVPASTSTPPTRPRSSPMDRLGQDLRYAIRSFARRPALTAVIVGTLALGIGANTAIFTVVNEIVLRPLPLGEPERVVDLAAKVPGGNSFTGFSYADFLQYQKHSGDALEQISAYTARRLRLGPDLEGERIVAQLTTPEYFQVVGVEPWIGRLPEPQGEPNAAVISHGFWQSKLGGDPKAVGSTLHLNGAPFTVVGIGPEGFSGTFIGYPTEVWLPLRAGEMLLQSFDLGDPEMRGLEFIGRLAPGVGLEQAQTALNLLASRFERLDPARNGDLRVAVHPTTGIDYSMRSGVVGFLGLLMAVAGLVLLITCLNVGGLLLARAAARQKEMAIRFAMGAGAARVVGQLITETLLLFALGAGLGVFVASRLTRAILLGLSDLPAPRGLGLGIDWRVLLFTAITAWLASLIAGLFPAREALKQDLVNGLRSRQAAPQSARLRGAFVVLQVAGAVALLIGAGLFLRSLQAGQSLDPGFEADRVAAGRLTLVLDEEDPELGLLRMQEVRRRLADLPGIESVALAQRPPIGVIKNPIEIDVEGMETPSGGALVVDANSVSRGYFETLEIPLVAGRAFGPEDRPDSPRVVIVNETMAQRFWPQQAAVGQELRLRGERATVVGIAGDSRYLIQDATPMAHVYLPITQDPSPRASVLVRSTGDVTKRQRELREAIQPALPAQDPSPFMTLRDDIDRSLLPQRLASAVMSALGSFGLLLASLGIYGVLAHGVNERRREIGIRLALGGRRPQVIRLVVASGMRLVLTGIVVGAGFALALTPLITRFLIGVAPLDIPTLGFVTLVLLAVGALACWAPALRAAAIDPAVSLRME